MANDALSGLLNLPSGNRSNSNKYGANLASVFDKRTDQLPNIIYAFRNGRDESVGIDDPTYFGFFMDIHSSDSEVKEIINPFTGLRANPLFYFPKDGSLDADTGLMSLTNNSKNFTNLSADPNEASAIQFLNHFGHNSLDLDQEQIQSNSVPLKNRSNDTLDGIKPDDTDINRGYYLVEFKHLLNLILTQSPWVFKEIDGLNTLWENSFKSKGEEVTVTIKCEESSDLRITKLAHYYKMLSWDSFNNRKLLPHNLEQFSMDVYMMDLRFLKNSINSSSGINIGLGFGSSTAYDPSFSAQINFGGIAFRCMGCTFDFSGFLDNYTSGVKSSVPETSFQPSFKIKIKRVLPASYFGDQSFGYASLGEPNSFTTTAITNAINGALDLGPFTGGVTRVLNAASIKLANILGTPERLLNDAIRGAQQGFEGAVNSALERPPLALGLWDKKSVEQLVNDRKGQVKSADIFPGVDTRTTNPITTDMFPGVDNRKAPPIRRDEFIGTDSRKANPIKTDVFPGKESPTRTPLKKDVFPGTSPVPTSTIKQDVFPGDVPVSTLINQRKQVGKITSQNPYKN